MPNDCMERLADIDLGARRLHLGVVPHDLGNELLERDWLKLNIATAKTGVSQDIVDEPFHARTAADNALEVIASFWVEPVAKSSIIASHNLS